MDRVTSPGSPLPTAGQADEGTELPIQDIGADRKETYEYPTQRPASRLGFNRPALPACSPVVPSEPDVDCKSQSEGGSQTPPSPPAGITTPPSTAMDSSALTAEASASGKIDETTPERACSANTTGAAHCERPVMRKTPSVSRLSFPFKTTGQRRAANAKAAPLSSSSSTSTSTCSPPPPPRPRSAPRHKHSCVHATLLRDESDSPLAASGGGSPYPQHQHPRRQHSRHPRYQYGQHGYSRTGLQHAKWFWAMREQEWNGEVSAHAVPSLAYGASVNEDFPPRRAGPSIDDVVGGKPPQLSPPIKSTVPELGALSPPPITIHPRRGDIASLRDPYQAHVDQCFVGMPAWTISKTLWMHDLQLATNKERAVTHIMDESDTESDLETVGSLYSSDDSDTTLVESENESDYPAHPKSSTGANKFRDHHVPKNVHRAHTLTHYAGPSSLTVAPPFKHHTTASDTMPLEIYNTSWASSRTSSSKSHSSSDSHHRSKTTTPWPTNWYRRWEVLARLCHQDQSQAHALITISSYAMEASLLSSRTAFYQRPSSNLNSNSEDGD